jgi:ankyrin repeat protein
MQQREVLISFAVVLPFLVFPWRFEPRRDSSPEAVQALARSKSPYAKETLAYLVSLQPNAAVDGVPVLYHAAIIRCNPNEVELLLNHGADPNARGVDGTPLLNTLLEGGTGLRFEPCFHDRLAKMARMLIDHGAGAQFSHNNKTPLDIELRGQTDITMGVEILLKAGADPNDAGNPLGLAVSSRRYEDAVTLLNAGAKVTSDGHEYLQRCLFDGQIHLPLALISRGVKYTPQDLQTLFKMILQSFDTDAPESFKFIMSLSPPLNVRFSDGETPLTTALDHPALLKALLAAGADPNFTTAAGLPPLAKAGHSSKCEEAIPLLLDQHADPNVRVLEVLSESAAASASLFGIKPRHDSLLQLALRQHANPACISLLAHAQQTIEDDTIEVLKNNYPDTYNEIRGRVAH